nr:hypothetical protein [uncultured Sellimonas sp.]
MPKGEANKLSKEEILQIQQMAAGGMTTGKIMEMTGRARSTVIRAVKGKLTPGSSDIRYAPHCECCNYRISCEKTRRGLMVQGCRKQVANPKNCRKWRD